MARGTLTDLRHSAPGRANGVLVLAIGTLSDDARRGQDMPFAQRLHRSIVGTAAQFLQFIDLILRNRADVLHYNPADAFGAGRRGQGAAVTVVVQVVGDVLDGSGTTVQVHEGADIRSDVEVTVQS